MRAGERRAPLARVGLGRRVETFLFCFFANPFSPLPVSGGGGQRQQEGWWWLCVIHYKTITNTTIKDYRGLKKPSKPGWTWHFLGGDATPLDEDVALVGLELEPEKEPLQTYSFVRFPLHLTIGVPFDVKNL